MESICELLYCLTPLLLQCSPSHVLVVIVTDMVILFLNCIHEKIPSGFDPTYSRLLCGNLILVSVPPMFEMVEILKECEGDIFPVGKKCE
jgi:hypothetical protein